MTADKRRKTERKCTQVQSIILSLTQLLNRQQVAWRIVPLFDFRQDGCRGWSAGRHASVRVWNKGQISSSSAHKLFTHSTTTQNNGSADDEDFPSRRRALQTTSVLCTCVAYCNPEEGEWGQTSLVTCVPCPVSLRHK